MKVSATRLVLAFYSTAEKDQAESAYRDLKDAGIRHVRLTGAPAQAQAATLYEALRLDAEVLLAVNTEPLTTGRVLSILREAGAPAIFVVRSGVPVPGEIKTHQYRPPRTRRDILARLDADKKSLDIARHDLHEAARLDHALPPSAEWVLDNSYLVRTQIAEVRRHLPRDYEAWPSSGNPEQSVPAMARELARSADFAVSESNILEFLRSRQSSAPSTIAELWAFPLFLRIAMIEEIAAIAKRVARSQQMREAAYLWANRLASAARLNPDELSKVLERLAKEPLVEEPRFATTLAEQLQDEETALAPVQQWIEKQFSVPVSDLAREIHTKDAAQTVSTANAFGSLRTLANLPFDRIFESASLVEQELRSDPAGIYPKSDFPTRDRCRRVIERIAARCPMQEIDVARTATRLAAENTTHVAFYLLSDGVTVLEKTAGSHPPFSLRLARYLWRNATFLYIATVLVLTLCFTAVAVFLSHDGGMRHHWLAALMAIFAAFPLSELAVQIANALAISIFPPERLSRLDYRGGIPAECATLVVVPMMLTSSADVEADAEKLEVRFLGNRDPNLFFSLFADFTDAGEQKTPQDDEVLHSAIERIEALNAKYASGGPDRFLLFHRQREWSETERAWIGRERKRGKLEELNAFLCGAGSGQILTAGKLTTPIAYVITLDADTQLPLEAGRRLIETIAHPLNRVEIDPVTNTRRRGYGVIQPRVSIALPGATATRFTRVFSDASGTDPYSRTVSDAHQDLFHEAMFHGKAIYDVHAFHAILHDRFPDETILSHDLIEGAHAGVGLATDIELFEHIPTDYGSFANREHRWIRGDWQIARWIWGTVPGGRSPREKNPLSVIGRWRILDNLRRSLSPIAAVMTLLLGWLFSGAPQMWSLIVALALIIPAIVPLLDRLARRVQGSVQRWQGAADELIRTLVTLAFLPHQAWISADAIIRVQYRIRVSRHKLLEWQTAAGARAQARVHLDATMRRLLMISGAAVALGIVLAFRHDLISASGFLVLWILAPLLTKWLAQPVKHAYRRLLKTDETQMLRVLARRTWRFFDDLVNGARNWLPPDNTQLALRVEIAERTSPTNIGLWLMSALSARDFGYLTVDEFCHRVRMTMGTLERLETYEGHLLNWYSTTTLEPLNPRYVSTVDSGNLIACLWVLKQGVHDVTRSPVIGVASLRGLSDTLSILEEKCGDDPSTAPALSSLRRLLRGVRDGHELVARFRIADGPIRRLRETHRWHADEASKDERNYWADRLANELVSWATTADRYLRWMEVLAEPPDSALRKIGPRAVTLRRRALHTIPSLETLANGSYPAVDAVLEWRAMNVGPGIGEWLDELAKAWYEAREQAKSTLRDFERIRQIAETLASAMKMSFLYDEKLKLFGVGYSVGGPREFGSHYDLLASECRVASLVAIAKGDVPPEHWFAMGRPFTTSREGEALLSWSGTMFEYLMPLLFTRTFENSLLERACRDAVDRQIEYGEQNQAPWGISESGYSAIDAHEIYQYHAFGVPSLALNPGVDGELVIAPYATVLALQVDPPAAIANLWRLERMNLLGPDGFYEAIDFTRETKREGERGVVIYSYMSHHQGMSMGALNNVLHRDTLQRRFHADLRIRAVETLLFEGIPITQLPVEEIRRTPSPVRTSVSAESPDRVWTEETPVPRVHLFGNGRMSAMVTNSGGAYLRWNDFDVTRWRSDPTLDPWGTFIFVRDERTNDVWASAHKPFSSETGESAIRFAADRAEYCRRVAGIETILQVTVSPEDDAELRRVRVTNQSPRHRTLEFTSFTELAMTPHGADKAHPAFARMFVETESPEPGVLVAHRRPRSPSDTPIWTAHILTGCNAADESAGVQFETDRLKFLGRGRRVDSAVALNSPLSGSTGTVIDPIFSLRCRLTLEPRDQKEIAFVTVAAADRESLEILIRKYARFESVSRVFEMAWTRVQLAFRFLGIGPGAAHRYQELASQLLYSNPRLRPSADRISRNHLGQQSLWAYGISGDLPIVTVTIAESRNMPLVRDVLLAHAYWRMLGLRADLVILNQEGASYDAPLRGELQRQIEAHASDAGIDRPGGIFVRDWHAIPEEQRNLILASSAIVLSAGRGSLRQQLVTLTDGPPSPAFVPAAEVHEEPSQPLPFMQLPYFNGLGGFTEDGREYAVYLGPEQFTPAPWVNVMANEGFGTMVSESGLGFTWFGNSQANRLTPWHNDPVSDPQSEVIYVRDEETGRFWSPTALPIRENDAYRARHGQGYTTFEHNSHAIGQELTVFVPIGLDGKGDPIKVCRLRLKNQSSRRRKLRVTWFAELVLGSAREDQQLRITVSRDRASGALIARQYWTGAWRGQCVFGMSSVDPVSWSGDRTSFLGRNGSHEKPAALTQRELDNRFLWTGDPAMALQVIVELDPMQEADVSFLLGQAATEDEVARLSKLYRNPEQIEGALQSTRDFWERVLGALHVETPVLSSTLLLNRWLLYQSLSCRFWGRSALYQSGGAFGFRDQLQDSMAFLNALPDITRRHILVSAARQFPEGDVQHWWHPETGMGVRTLCSDDFLWLPYVVSQYVRVTGDRGVLDEPVAFLQGPLLGAGEHERMFLPTISPEEAPLWEHCRRALEHGWRLGPHGLPLMGNGDWNDGMNLVGASGKGESIWLAWFLCVTLDGFAEIMESHPQGISLAADWRGKATELRRHTEETAWDGDWYLRAFFDDGSPLGSHKNEEAKIDSLPQSWSVVAGGDPKRAQIAMQSAERELVREKEQLVLLFTPPFDHSQPNPGYIMGYPPGLRENGGQYTHGSLWMSLAWARLRDGGRAVRLLQIMNPIELSRGSSAAAHYRGEPYVVAADVYSAPGHVGQAGWTWYTGSAGWMYRIWIEEVLGFRLRGTMLIIDPVIPESWEGFRIRYRYRSSTYAIEVKRGSSENPAPYSVHLADDGQEHSVVIGITQKARSAESEPAKAGIKDEVPA